MTSRSSIFSFDTLKPGLGRVRGIGLSLLLAGAVLGTCEVGARVLHARSVIEEDKSLRVLVEARIEEIETRRPPIWMLGNSTLDWGIDQKQFEAETGEKIVKLSHGAATVQGSAEMLDYYFRHTTARPSEIIFTTTKDDFNANGSRAATSERYLEIERNDALPSDTPSVLRNARTDLRQKALPLVFVEKAEKVASFDKNTAINESFMNDLIKDYVLELKWIDELKAVCEKNGVKKLTVILLPVTDRNQQYHDKRVKTPKYNDIRQQIVARCAAEGIAVVDWATPRTDYNKFRDSYHLNAIGMKWQTHRLSELRQGRAWTAATTPTSNPTTKQ